MTYNKDISGLIKDYSSQELPVLTEAPEEVIENKRTLWVHPIKANLEGGSKSWSFRVGKDETITANIIDEQFLADIKSSTIRLASADLLKVEIVQKQIIKGSTPQITTEIVKVDEYKRGPEQLKISRD